MKRTKALAVVLVALTLVGCEPAKTPKSDPTNAAGLKTTFGDGVWIVGDEVEPGFYQSDGKIEGKEGCVWFVSPAPSTTPGKYDPSFRDSPPPASEGQATFRVKDKQAITTSGCGKWHLVQ